jgi:hypothetical protein
LGASIVAVIALAVTAAPTAGARDDGGRQHYQGAPTEAVVDAPFCDANGRCLLGFRFRNAYTGDVVGTEVSAGQIALTGPFDGPGTSTSVLTATIAGCPSEGSVTLRWQIEFGATTVGRNTGTFKAVPGSGTGGLTGIRGGGSFVTTFHPDGSVTSDFTANFRCRR